MTEHSYRPVGRGSPCTSLSISGLHLLPQAPYILIQHPSRISYGTGRPAILKDDDSIAHCRELLSHPLAVEDDMRLVSTVELMAVRERINARLSPVDVPMDENTFRVLSEADTEFQIWYKNWDPAFAQRYEDAGE
jgi:hypothetical protein